MSTKTKTLAKSLHTVTAIAAIARRLEALGVGSNLIDAGAARDKQIAEALDVLGYAGAADPYELASKARALLDTGK